MSIPRVANNNCRQYVQKRKPFQGSHLYARKYALLRGSMGDVSVSDIDVSAEHADRIVDEWYVVYSYGEHWPLFVYAGGHWYENRVKYSRTTSKQHSQAHPHEPTTPMSEREITQLARRGLVRYMQDMVQMKVMA